MIKRQSEHDSSRGSMRNGLIDGTKCQSSEQKGICYDYCVLHIQQIEVVILRDPKNTQTQNGSNTSNSWSYISVWKSGFMIQITNLK